MYYIHTWHIVDAVAPAESAESAELVNCTASLEAEQGCKEVEIQLQRLNCFSCPLP